MSIELFDVENYSLIKFKKYKIVEKKKIGVGGFSKVYSGHYKSLPLAIKKFKNFDLKEFTKEIRIIKKFKHPRVPHLYGVCKEEKTEKLSLISELVTGETLDSYLKKNSCKELEILVHLIELTKILEFFHSNKVIHRDLKPSNIMIDHNMNLRLLDFGISKITSNSLTTTIAMGTLMYMAPENFQISETASSSDLTTTSLINSKVDVWALGCIIDEIFSGHKPWSSIAKENARIIGHLFSKSNFPINRDIIKRNCIIELIESCTIIEPSKRIDIKQAKINLMKILFNDVIKDDYFAHYNAKKRYHINNKILNIIDFFCKYHNLPINSLKIEVESMTECESFDNNFNKDQENLYHGSEIAVEIIDNYNVENCKMTQKTNENTNNLDTSIILTVNITNKCLNRKFSYHSNKINKNCVSLNKLINLKEISCYKSPEIFMSDSNSSILKRKYSNDIELINEKPRNEVILTNKRNSLNNFRGFIIPESSNLLQILEKTSKKLNDLYKNNLSIIINYYSCMKNENSNEKKSCTINSINNSSLNTQSGKKIENEKLMIRWKDNCKVQKSLLVFPYYI